MTNEIPDAPLVVAAFLARYCADEEVGAVQSREGYQNLFPGYAEVVGAEFDRLQQGEERPERVEGERLAGYRIVRELGRGGQGIVYLAEDERLERQVALKVLPGAYSATVARQRLLREAQAASRLEDPGICTVYDAGEQDGVAFIAMQFVEGKSLHERIERERQERPALADAPRIQALLCTFEAVLRSLHRAHEKGLVHRDVKPSNLMLADDGTPRILDFGLAAFDDHPDGSLTGEVALGTPAYMSPEQLSAREGRVDARSDVFSLAVTMYEAVTLHHPFEAPTRERLYQHILEGEPAPLRKVARGLPRDLDVVLQCALAKDRTRRYASALAFAEDLRSVRLHEPITARPVGPLERTARWAQRNPLVATLAGMLLVAIAVGVGVVLDKNADLHASLRKETEARRDARSALDKEKAARARSYALYLVGLAQGQFEEDPELALLLAREAREKLDHHLTRTTLRRALEIWRPRPLVEGVAGAEWVDVSPDGTRVAIAYDDVLALHDAATRAPIHEVACKDAGNARIWWSDDSSRLLLAERNRVLFYEDGEIADAPLVVRVLDRNGAQLYELPGHRGKLHTVDFDGRFVVTGDGAPDRRKERDGTVRIWSLDTGAKVFELGGHEWGAEQVRFHGQERAGSWPDLETLSRGGVYRRVQGRSGKVLQERRLVAANARRLPEVFLGAPGVVYVDDGDRLQRFQARTDDEPAAVARDSGTHSWGPGGPLLRQRRKPQTLAVLDADDLTLERELHLPAREVVHVGHGRRVALQTSLFPNTRTTWTERTLIAVFADGSMREWATGSSHVAEHPAIAGGVVAADLSSDGRRVAVLDPEGQVRVFSTDEGGQLPTVADVRVGPLDALHPDGRHVLAFRRDHAVLVDMANGADAWTVEPVDGERGTVAAWSPDGELVAVGDDGGLVRVLRRADGEQVFAFGGDRREVRQLTFSRDGRQLLVLCESVEVWSVEAQRRLRGFEDVPMVASARLLGDGADTHVALSHTTSHQLYSLADGERIGTPDEEPWHLGVASVAGGGYALVTRLHEAFGSRVGGFGENWLLDARSGQRRRVGDAQLEYGRGGISPDGDLLVLTVADGSLQLFDRERFEVVRTLRGHDHICNRVVFSADGSLFASCWAAGSFEDALDERRLCIWSRDGDLLQQFRFGRSGLSWFEVSPDGRWVVVKTNDGLLRRLPVRPQELVRQLALRDFTEVERARYELR